MDLDFSNIQMFPPANYAGLIVLRFAGQGPRHRAKRVRCVLAHINQEPIVVRFGSSTNLASEFIESRRQGLTFYRGTCRR